MELMSNWQSSGLTTWQLVEFRAQQPQEISLFRSNFQRSNEISLIRQSKIKKTCNVSAITYYDKSGWLTINLVEVRHVNYTQPFDVMDWTSLNPFHMIQMNVSISNISAKTTRPCFWFLRLLKSEAVLLCETNLHAQQQNISGPPADADRRAVNLHFNPPNALLTKKGIQWLS